MKVVRAAKEMKIDPITGEIYYWDHPLEVEDTRSNYFYRNLIDHLRIESLRILSSNLTFGKFCEKWIERLDK